MSSHVTDTRISRADIGLRSERGPVLLSVMLAIGLVAVDATILATAVPAIVDDLGGFTQFPWLFSVYLLVQAVTVPIYAKLADLFGRKPVMLTGIALFVLGSVLCGCAWSMGSLIAFRALQGLGAGAVQPTGLTIVGDIYSLAERARVQGYIASVWATSSLVGPALGGVFADYASWRLIFWVNLPIGIAAAWVLARSLDEQVERRRHRIDYPGALLLAGGAVLLLLALLEGGIRWAWSSATSIGLLGSAVLLLVAFVLAERRAAEPVLPLWVLRSRTIDAAAVGQLTVGVLQVGLASYVPLYAQGVLGHGAVVGGFALAGMTLGWPVAATLAGRLYLSLGFRFTLLLGAACTLAGCALLLTVRPDSPVLLLMGACSVIGLGLGFVASPAVVAAQQAVTWEHRGVVTGVNMFARSIGSALGVAAFGAIVNGMVAARMDGVSSELELLPADVLAPAVQAVFAVSAGVAVILVAAGLLMPRNPSIAEATDQ